MPVLGSGPGCGGTDTEGGLTHSSTLMKPRGSWRRPQRIPPRTRSCGERAAGAGAPGRHQGLLRGTGGTAPGDWGGYTGGCSEGQGGLHRGTGELQRELARAGGCSGTPDCCTRTAAGRWEAAPGVAPGHRGRGALHRELHGRTGGCTGGCMGTPGAAPGVTPGVAPGHRGAASGDCPGHLGVRGGGGFAPEPYLEPGPFVAGRGGGGLRHGRAGGGRCCLRRPLGPLRCQSRHREPHSPRGWQHRPAPCKAPRSAPGHPRDSPQPRSAPGPSAQRGPSPQRDGQPLHHHPGGVSVRPSLGSSDPHWVPLGSSALQRDGEPRGRAGVQLPVRCRQPRYRPPSGGAGRRHGPGGPWGIPVSLPRHPLPCNPGPVAPACPPAPPL